LCNNPNSLGLSRVIEIDTTGGPACKHVIHSQLRSLVGSLRGSLRRAMVLVA
jgi:hypothetical protein